MTDPEARVTVSVVIPIYNGQEWIAETLDSVCAQTYQIAECIVVDDGSTDSSATIIENFAKQSQLNIHLINTSNRGQAAARNTGIAAARGDMIAFLDADDCWHPEKIAAQMELMNAKPGTMCVCAFEFFRGSESEGVIKFRRFGQKELERWLAMEGHGMAISSTALVRKRDLEAIGVFESSLSVCEDLELAIRLFDMGEVLYVPEVLVGTRMHQAQEHNNVMKLTKNMELLYDRVFIRGVGGTNDGTMVSLDGRWRDKQFERRCRGNINVHAGLNLIRRGRIGEGIIRLSAAFRVDPKRLISLPMYALKRVIERRWRTARINRRYYDPRTLGQ